MGSALDTLPSRCLAARTMRWDETCSAVDSPLPGAVKVLPRSSIATNGTSGACDGVLDFPFSQRPLPRRPHPPDGSWLDYSDAGALDQPAMGLLGAGLAGQTQAHRRGRSPRARDRSRNAPRSCQWQSVGRHHDDEGGQGGRARNTSHVRPWGGITTSTCARRSSSSLISCGGPSSCATSARPFNPV